MMPLDTRPEPWRVEVESVGGWPIGYVLKNASGQYYEKSGAVVTWLDETEAEADCAALNAGGKNDEA